MIYLLLACHDTTSLVIQGFSVCVAIADISWGRHDRLDVAPRMSRYYVETSMRPISNPHLV
jgi:hypothetical protein